MTTPIANDLLVIYYTDSTIDSVIVNPSQDDFDNAFASGAAFATIPAGSPSSDIERFAPKPVEPTDDEIRQELEADYLAESESLSKFHAEERDHASFIGSQLRKLFSAGCRIALINPDRPNAEFVVRVSTAHDQLMLQAPIYGGLYSDIYSVMEADEFSLRRYAPAPGKRFSLAAAAYVRRALYKFAFGHRLGLEKSENAAPLHDSSLTSENAATLPKSANTSTLAPDDDAHFLTTHVALMNNKAEIGTVLTRGPL
jgi:hypothetical protein